jgi:DUF971 family protein
MIGNNNKIKKIIYNKIKKNLHIEFFDNYNAILSAELLRVESPSAEVQGHSSKEKKTPLNKQNISITQIERVGNYAIRIIFDDGHDTGIYSWSYLREISEKSTKLYEDYLNRLSKSNNV